MSVRQLPHGVIKLISSTQVISSVSTVVKELVENSIDAGATVIDIKLERSGLNKIEIRDNGCGIAKSDAYNVCLPNYTSKIYSFDDLECLKSYGFRGEALNSLCAVSHLSITTKPETEDIASMYVYDNNGTVREVLPSHFMKGTIVTVTNLFKNVPVRRQFYESTKKATEELKKIEKVVKILSVIHPKLRITVAHNKCLIWQKTAVNNLRQSLMQVYPHVILKNLVEFNCSHDDLTVEMLICKRDCNWSVLCQPLGEAILFFVNKRPVKDKKVEKVVLEEMTHLFASSLPYNKCPLTLISLTMPPQNLDINLEPDKSKIFMKNHEEVLKQIRESIMLHFYEQPVGGDSPKLMATSSEKEVTIKRKVDDKTADDIILKKFRQEEDILPKIFHDVSSNDISNRNEKNANAVKNDLADLDASQFNEDSRVEELFSLKSESCENIQNERLNPLDGESQMQEMDDIPESQNTLSFSLPFEFNENNKSVPVDNIEEALNGENDDRELEFYNENDAIRHEFDLNFSLSESTLDKMSVSKCEVDGKNESNSILEKVMNQTTLSQWSRGHVNVRSAPLEGGTIVVNKLPPRLLESNVEREKKSEKQEKLNEPLSPHFAERSVSSQMGRKDLAGLTNFARTVRSEIIKENPGISFAKVASELANRWRNLKDDEKNVFSEQSKATKHRKVAVEAPVAQLIKKTTVLVDVSIDTVKDQLRTSKKISQSNIRVIGTLRSGSEWTCRIGNTIMAIHVSLLKENVLSHRLLSHVSVPNEPLDEPVLITTSDIGIELWKTLISLEKCNFNGPKKYLISDPRILKNGFKIILEEEVPETFTVSIIEIPNECRYCLVETLVETLKLVQNYDDLNLCRPAVIKRILMAKTSIGEDSPLPKKEEIAELLAYWVQTMSQISVCSTDIPVNVKLFSLP